MECFKFLEIIGGFFGNLISALVGALAGALAGAWLAFKQDRLKREEEQKAGQLNTLVKTYYDLFKNYDVLRCAYLAHQEVLERIQQKKNSGLRTIVFVSDLSSPEGNNISTILYSEHKQLIPDIRLAYQYVKLAVDEFLRRNELVQRYIDYRTKPNQQDDELARIQNQIESLDKSAPSNAQMATGQLRKTATQVAEIVFARFNVKLDELDAIQGVSFTGARTSPMPL